MKKSIALLTALLPVIYAGIMQLSAALGTEDHIFLPLLFGFLVLGFLLPVIYAFIATRADRKFLAVSNLWFYVGNLTVFAYEIALWLIRFHENHIAEQNGATEGGLGLFLLILLFLPHWISYLCVRIAGAVSTARILKDLCADKVRVLHICLQVFPCADLISAIWVLRKVTRSCCGLTPQE